jgi:hypothetical protein
MDGVKLFPLNFRGENVEDNLELGSIPLPL